VAGIIFLHGASSSGKSTLARELQAKIEGLFWHWSIDHLRDAGVVPMARFRSGNLSWKDQREKFLEGFHQSVAAFSNAGNNLIIEHILDTPGWRAKLATLLAPHDVLFVGIRCDIDELNRREAARGDRPIGDAARDERTIHEGLRYDLTLQSEDGTEANVIRVLAAWVAPRQRSAFFD
jgi:chloramphenicol 3-O phosphotransferase